MMTPILKYTIIFIICFNGYSIWSQVGINTENPQTMLDINGNLSLNATPVILNNGNNDLGAGDYSLFNISGPTDTFSINTILPLNDVDGQIITLVNTTPHTMTLANNFAADPNSIICTNNADLVLKGIKG